MDNSKPLNISLLDVDDFIKRFECREVKSPLIREASSNSFHHEGLFSEEIFGQIGSPQRLINFGYINLRTKVLHPVIYKNLLKLKSFIADIMAGTKYARYNSTTSELEIVSADDPQAGTGYGWFLKQLPKLKFTRNESRTQNDRVDVVEKYHHQLFITKLPVLPAGVRDMKVDEMRPASDSINSIYCGLMHYVEALPEAGSEDPLFDPIRYAMQKKVEEIYNYLFDMLDGKNGFFQRKYGSRNLALATRNVIGPADLSGTSPTDPHYLKISEIGAPLYQAANMFRPLVVWSLKQNFFARYMSNESTQIGMIDPKTLTLHYEPIDEDERTQFLSTEGIEKLIERFRDKEFRVQPVVVHNQDGDTFYLALIYDLGDRIIWGRSITDLKTWLSQHAISFDAKKLRPVTWYELMYHATYLATKGKHCTVTRYPAIEVGSCVPCDLHILTTNPARKVLIYYAKDATHNEPTDEATPVATAGLSPAGAINLNQPTAGTTLLPEMDVVLPEYPVLGNSAQESTILHPSIMAGLNADFDGNCVVGSTIVSLRYCDNWLQSQLEAAQLTVDVAASRLHLLCQFTYRHDGIWHYARLPIKCFPYFGDSCPDRHGARVYAQPYGCEILSILPNGEPAYMPITAFTVEENCECCHCRTANRAVTVSANASLAVFSPETGELIKVSPQECMQTARYAPYQLCSLEPFGQDGTWDEGFQYGSQLWQASVRCQPHEPCPAPPAHSICPDTPCFYGCPRFKKPRPLPPLEQQTPDKSLDWWYGVLSAILSLKSAVQEAEHRNWNYDQSWRISCESAPQQELVRQLLFRLGIDYRWLRQEQIVELNPAQLRELDDTKLVLIPQQLRDKYRQLRQRLPEIDQWDVVPLTYTEALQLMVVFQDHQLVQAQLSATVPYLTRELGLQRLEQIRALSPKLAERLQNRLLHWNCYTGFKEEPATTVYDFLVPDSKVFAVNDGLIVYDTVCLNGIMTDEANQEVTEHLQSKSRWIQANGKFYNSWQDVVALTMYNLSRDPEEEIKKK